MQLFKEIRICKEYPDYGITPDGCVIHIKSGQEIKQAPHSAGYVHVGLRPKGKSRQVKILVHRLVASLYCTKPEGLNDVNHIDGNKTNNHYTNLEWCSRSYNIQHAYDTGLHPQGEGCTMSKLTELQIREICMLFQEGMGVMGVSKLLKIPYGTLNDIHKRRTWKPISECYSW